MDQRPADDENTIAFVLALARALHRYGTPANRLEEALVDCCRHLGLDEAEVFTTPTTIIMSFGEPAELRTRMLRVDVGEVDMHKLVAVDHLADQITAREIPISEGLARLREIDREPRRYSHVMSTCMHAVAAGSFAVFFGGSLDDVLASGLIGLILGVLAQVLKRSVDRTRIFELIGAVLASAFAGLLSAVWLAISPSLVAIASLIILLPGTALTVAMGELTTRHIMAGTSRLMFAVIVLVELVVGVAVGERIAGGLVDIQYSMPHPLPAWTQWIALVTSTLAVSIIVGAGPRAFPWIVLAAFVGFVGTQMGNAWLGRDMGVIVGAFALGVTSNVYARWWKRPAQAVQVPAVLTLVPGSMGFRGIASLLGHDTVTGLETVFAMFIVAIAIAAGLLVANAAMSPRRSL